MNRSFILAGVLISLWLIAACSGSPVDPDPLPPGEDSAASSLMAAPPVGSGGQDRYLWGYWNISYDPVTERVESVPVRTTDIHLNTLKFLEKTMCQNCLILGQNWIDDDGNLVIEIGLQHPVREDDEYDMDVFTGFDVRGIAIFRGTDYFDQHGLLLTNHYHDEFTLNNADGYTTLWSPTLFPPDPDGREIFQYLPGKYEVNGVNLPTTLNPFRAFHTLPERRTFEAGKYKQLEYVIGFPEDPSGVLLEFGYAVDASFARPVNMDDPVVPDDFPIRANAIEPYRITAEFEGPLTPLGGSTTATIRVYCWQGNEHIERIKLEAPDLFNGMKVVEEGVDQPQFKEFTVSIENEMAAALGAYPVLVSAEVDMNVPLIGVVNGYNLFQLEVLPPLNLETTVELEDCLPVEARWNPETEICYFSPTPGIENVEIMGIDSDWQVVDGFPEVIATGGMGLCIDTAEVYLATDIGTLDDISVYKIIPKVLHHTIDVPALIPGNPGTQPVDFVVFEPQQEIWFSMYLENQLGKFFTTIQDPDITRIDVGSGPTTVALDKTNYRVFVACEGNDTVTVIDGYDPTNPDSIDTIDLQTPLESPDPLLPATPGMVYVPVTDTFYITTLMAGKVDYYSMADLSYKGSITLAAPNNQVIVGLAYDDDAGVLVATGQGIAAGDDGHLWMIDPVTNAELYETTTSDMHPSFPGLDPDNHILYVPDPIGLVDVFRIVY